MLKATTLVETLVALLLLSIAFSIGMMVYLNLVQSNTNYSKSKANTLLKFELQQAIQQRTFYDKEYKKSGFSIERKILKNNKFRGTHTLELTAFTPNKKKIITIKKIVHPQ